MIKWDSQEAIEMNANGGSLPIELLLQRLVASEERFRSIIDKSADAILIIDEQGVIQFANPESENLFGRSSRELLGQPFGYPVIGASTTEIEILRKGRLPVVSEMKVVATGWDNRPALLATLRDVSRRKWLEENLQSALADSETARNQIDTILRSVGEGLIVTDNRQQVILINQAAELLLGVTCRQVYLQPIESLFAHRDSQRQFPQNLALKPGEPFDFELPGPDPKRPRQVQAKAALILDSLGNQLGLVTTLQDVTNLREVERMKSEFVSLAAHELGSPLTCIIGFAELLLDNPGLSSEERRDMLHTIREQGFAMRDIIGSFLDLARIEAGQPLPLKEGVCTVSELMEKLEPFVRINQEKYRIEFDLTDGDALILVDRKRLGQVLENLLSNATKYSAPGTLIRVVGRRTGSDYQFSVQDQGIGMTPDQVERIFDKFYRANAGDKAISGLGLGMSIVKFIVEAHQGKIWVESCFNQGTTVWFTIPLQHFDLQEQVKEPAP